MNAPLPTPPRWAQWLLRWLHPADTLEEVEGDLDELYAYWHGRAGKTQATLRYVLNVVSVLPPFVRRREPKRYSEYASPTNTTMLRNYLKIVFRNLIKNKASSAINVGGLAVGMAVAMLIGLWIYDELSFDTYHTHYDHIAQVMQHQTVDGQVSTNYSIPLPLEAELRSKYRENSGIKRIVLTSWIYGHVLEMGDRKFVKKGGFMQPDAPEMLSLRMLKGTRQGLRDPGSILLAESVAKAYFGDNGPMGNILKLDNKMAVRVTGVYQDLPQNTTFRDLTFIAPWALLINTDESVRQASQQWDNNSFQLFVQVAEKADIGTISRLLKNSKLEHVDKSIALTKPEIFLEAMPHWHLHSDWKNGVNVSGRIQYV